MSWNIAFDKIMEIKKEYLKYTRYNDTQEIYNPEKYNSCIEKWLNEMELSIDDEIINKVREYKNIIEPLKLNQYKDLILLKYNDLYIFANGYPDEFWNSYDGLYRETRSLVIDLKNEKMVLTPFRKFRNMNESEETSYENVVNKIKSAKVVEFSNKLDGSMQAARYYNGKIIMSGSQALDPEKSYRLKDGYNMLTKNHKKMIIENPDYTFIFEHIAKNDAHVVMYDHEGMYLIGMRNVNTGEELPYKEILNYAKKYDINTTTIYDIDMDTLLKEAKTAKSNEKEGWVLNIDGWKVKIKCDDYIQMHRIMSSLSSPNVIIQSIGDGTLDDLLGKLPSAHHQRVLEIANNIFKYAEEKEKDINKWFDAAPKKDRKEFMLWVDKNVPKDINGYVKSKYLKKEYNLIKIRPEQYIKYNDVLKYLDKGKYFQGNVQEL